MPSDAIDRGSSEGDDAIAARVKSSLEVKAGFWPEEACAAIEAEIESLPRLARAGKFRQRTVDRTPLRSKYFFGYGYTYGSQISKKGEEQILPPELIDPVPDWIYDKLILSVEEAGLVREGWINSAVVNDYRPGGMIVSHIDPPQLFARPILIASFFVEGQLAFGSRFSFPNKGGPPVTSAPQCVCRLPRGSLTIMDGFSADGITHGIRPQDLDGRRVSIVLRHVFPNAPRLGKSLAMDSFALDNSWTSLHELADRSETAGGAAEEAVLPSEAAAAEGAGRLAGAAAAPGPAEGTGAPTRPAGRVSDEIDEFGRRRRKDAGDPGAVQGRGDGSARTDRQRAALERLQGHRRVRPGQAATSAMADGDGEVASKKAVTRRSRSRSRRR